MAGSFIALSANLFTMFIGYEILTLCTIPLIAHSNSKKTTKELSKYLKILMLSGLILFLPAIVGHGDFTLGFIKGCFSNTYVIILLLLLIFGIAKAAIYPLHGWLPAAMVASCPVSALLHAVVVVKTDLFCIYKILCYVFGFVYQQSLFASYNWLVILPIITILYSSIQAIRHSQIKNGSGFNQLNIALLSSFLLTPKGLIAAVMHIHLQKYAFFLCCRKYL